MNTLDGGRYYGGYGGCYVPEVLRPALARLEVAFDAAWDDGVFRAEFRDALDRYVGRPTPLYRAERLSGQVGGSDIYIKLEGLANTGAHKINNATGQALLAKRMGKRRVIAETGAGQHGVATAAACARLGLECTIYMGSVDMERQRPNVLSMELYGARVVPVPSGSRTLKDAINEALRDWASSYPDTHYLIGSALGPAPYPRMVRAFQSVIGDETSQQLKDLGIEPGALVACVGGGSNAIGFFSPFLDAPSPRLIGVEAGGQGPGKNAVRMDGSARDGVAHGYRSRFLADPDGQIAPTWSISAGLDYPGIGPELAALGQRGRVEFASATDREALAALKTVARAEGLLFALESAHAAAHALKLAAAGARGQAIVVNMSGRGDKDIFITAPRLCGTEWKAFLEHELAKLEQKDGAPRE